jgi:hypothetical protein
MRRDPGAWPANYVFCAAARAKTRRAAKTAEKNAKTAAEIVKALQDSAYCDAAYTALTDATAAEMTTVFGGKQSRISALMGNTNHNSEHYGNLVTCANQRRGAAVVDRQ